MNRRWKTTWKRQIGEGKKSMLILAFAVESRTHLKIFTLPMALAVIWPFSATVKLAIMLSSKNKPSGSFFPTAYHTPAYYRKESTCKSASYLDMSPKHSK